MVLCFDNISRRGLLRQIARWWMWDMLSRSAQGCHIWTLQQCKPLTFDQTYYSIYLIMWLGPESHKIFIMHEIMYSYPWRCWIFNISTLYVSRRSIFINKVTSALNEHIIIATSFRTIWGCILFCIIFNRKIPWLHFIKSWKILFLALNYLQALKYLITEILITNIIWFLDVIWFVHRVIYKLDILAPFLEQLRLHVSRICDTIYRLE